MKFELNRIKSNTSLTADFLNNTIIAARDSGDLVRYRAAVEMRDLFASGNLLAVGRAEYEALCKVADASLRQADQ